MSIKSQPLSLHPDRLFSSDPAIVSVARELYEEIKDLPIVSPHGHTDPKWFNKNPNFGNATELFIKPDHYVFRMLYSQGIDLNELGIPEHGIDGDLTRSKNADPKKAWQIFADNYYLFAGTPSGYWLDAVFCDVFGFKEKLNSENAQQYYDKITAELATDAYKPQALMDRFNIELIATTEGALDSLEHHKEMADTAMAKRVITTFRPDDVVDASREDFTDNLAKLGELTDQDTSTWQGYLEAVRIRRAYFKKEGRATATDHGHPSAITADLSLSECEALFKKCRTGNATEQEQELPVMPTEDLPF